MFFQTLTMTSDIMEVSADRSHLILGKAIHSRMSFSNPKFGSYIHSQISETDTNELTTGM